MSQSCFQIISFIAVDSNMLHNIQQSFPVYGISRNPVNYKFCRGARYEEPRQTLQV